ncbi:lysylphosphatidylglycerol synthase transmembrane domain-containing protein [Kordia antarctica]|uniref:lysylphosphatidylglycerol synthase transmembrane domain-containing protein n=1 Tax=Kordia antarctica TaxID=1218801 RepID=UPI001D1487B9|nr:lysylphosphatidylglycerol synthase transmembrane domain-containing protein [Kordia antarctica]
MKTSVSKILKIILPLFLGVFLVWYSLSKTPLDELINHFKKANYYWIVLGVFFGILSHLSRAYRWQYMLEPMGFKPKYPNSIMAVFIAYLANLGIPRSGEALRALTLTNYEGVPFEKGFGTIVAERVADLIVMLFVIAITLCIQFDFIWNLLMTKLNPTKIIILLVIMMVFGIALIIFIKKAKTGIALKIKNFILGIYEGATSILKMKNKWGFIFHTLFIWSMYMLMFYVTILSVEDLHGEVPVGAILIAFIAGSFSIAATNGGIGLYPIAVAGAFSLFGIARVPSEAFGWIMWSSQTLMVIILGGLSFLYLPIFNSKK